MRLELERAAELAILAGREIVRVYSSDFAVEHKQGEGPVTAADRLADKLIREGLSQAFPADALLSEETPDDPTRLAASRLWLIDPLDGTRQFVHRIPEFAVMIGLAIDGQPRLGVIHLPVEQLTYLGVVGEGAFEIDSEGRRRELCLKQVDPQVALRAAISRLSSESRTRRIVDDFSATTVVSGSVGRKAVLVARGDADFYLTLSSRSQHWDACAADALVQAAGGSFSSAVGEDLIYNTASIRNEHGLLAARPGLRDPIAKRVDERFKSPP